MTGIKDDNNLEKNIEDIIVYGESVEMPMIPLRGISISPSILQSFDIGRLNSIESFELSMINDEKIFLVSQFDSAVEEPTIEDLYTIGTVCNIKQVIRTSDTSIRVLVEGVSRAKLDEMWIDENDAWIGRILPISFDEEKLSDDKRFTLEAYSRKLIKGFDEYVSLAVDIPSDAAMELNDAEGYSMLADIVSSSLFLKFSDRQKVLVTLDIEDRMKMLYEHLLEEIEV
ncbi:LON peptidase substrate-binding domain-containing protein, partial [Peptostreptococcus porci]